MQTLSYNRPAALAYAARWAYRRNPSYLNFDNIGGDCTNFISQCLYAGSGVMNPRKTFGWYYYSADNRTPSWTGVSYLYNFLTQNQGIGPYARQTEGTAVQPGDLIQLGTQSGSFYHTLMVTKVYAGRIFVAAHSDDAYMRPLDSYEIEQVRFLTIAGVRKG